MKKYTTLLGAIVGLYFGLLILSVQSLRCYVCNDCETYYNETQLIDCDKDDMCIKTIEAGNGLVSRDCGDKKICTKEIPVPSNKGKSEKILKPNNKNSREKRSPPLLSPETKTTIGPPPPLISSLHCCEDEDGCNASPSIQPKITLLIFLSKFIVFHAYFD